MLNTVIINMQEGKDERIIWCENNLYAPDNETISYEIVNNRLIAHGNIIIPDNLGQLEVKIDEVYGSIYLENTLTNAPGNFISLVNFPDIVHGSVNISVNKNIKSFEGCPKRIEGYFKCNTCGFTTTDGIAEHIGGILKLYNNPIENIDRLMKIYTGCTIDLDFTNVKPTNESYKRLFKDHKVKAYDYSWN